MLMGAVVINHQMNVQIVRHTPVNMLEQGEEFLMAVPTLALRQHFPGGYIQSSKQCCRTIMNSVVGNAFPITQSQRQHRLGSLHCLDLRLLIYTEHAGVIWWF